MKNKYNMSQEENILLVKQKLIKIMYNSAKLESLSVTLSQTEEILEKGQAQGISYFEILIIKNIKSTWDYIFKNIDEKEIRLSTFQDLHEIIGNDDLVNKAGLIRETEVRITGTKWFPKMPSFTNTKNDILDIVNQNKSVTEKAIELMIKLMKTQFFLDGNKRTSTMLANLYMIQNGCGIITIPEEKLSEFRNLLLHYYETDEQEELKN